jgi:hypothetical protein
MFARLNEHIRYPVLRNNLLTFSPERLLNEALRYKSYSAGSHNDTAGTLGQGQEGPLGRSHDQHHHPEDHLVVLDTTAELTAEATFVPFLPL